MAKQKVLSSNMAATPLSFGSLGIGCKPPICKSSSDYIIVRVDKIMLTLAYVQSLLS